jgi:PPOX class probable F420-dependent enzyme
MTPDTANYISLRSKKKDGSQIDTPVWFVRAPDDDSYHVFTNVNSGKVKRVRNFPEVEIAVCDIRGKLLGEWQPARAEIVAESDTIYAAFRAKYGLTFRIFDFFSWLGGKHKERQMIQVTTDPAKLRGS